MDVTDNARRTELAPSGDPALNAVEWRAAEMLHSGEYNHKAIYETVKKGKTWWFETRRKPAFQAALHEMEEETREQGLRLLKANAVRVTKALLQCATEGRKASRVTALKAIMEQLYGGRPQTEIAVIQAQQQDWTQLPPDLKRKVLEALGGPVDAVAVEVEDVDEGGE